MVAKNVNTQESTEKYVDPVVECYKKDVDRTILRENLKLSVQERADQFMQFMRFAEELRRAGELARAAGKL